MSLKIGFTVKDLLNDTGRCLIPATALDAEQLQKFKAANGEIYECEFTKVRNYLFHKRYFAMLKVVLDVMDETVRKEKGITTIETLLLRLKLELGHCDMLWIDTYQSMVMVPKSISFASMDEFEFRKFYSDTLDQAISSYLPDGGEPTEKNNWRDFVNDAVMKLVGFF